MIDGADIQEALKSIKAAQASPDLKLGKASSFVQSASATSGLTYYDLELGAKFLYPVLTPLRNTTPRVSGKGGIQAAWRAVTNVNVNGIRIGVSGGNRNAAQVVSTQDYTASYKGIGIETSVDFEAEYAGQGFDDIRAIGAKTGLESLMLGEEAMILGGNGSQALGAPSTPVVSTALTGGAIAATQVVSVIVVALTLDGFLNGSLAAGIQGRVSRTNVDGSSDAFGGGSSAKSTAASVSTGAGATNSVLATTNAKANAIGYAWFWGTVGNERLGAITTINSVLITTAAGTSTGTTGVLASEAQFSADASTNSLSFDGLLTQAFAPGSGATIYQMPTGAAGIGTPLTADGSGGIVEIDIVLKAMWDGFKLGPDTMWVSSQEALNISKKILQGGQSSAQRFVFNTEQANIGGGIMVRTYLNRFSMQGGSVVDIKVHPNMPAGTVLFTSVSIPYPLSGVGNVMQIRTRQDYFQIEWPLRSRKYEYGVYADEVLQHFFPPSMAVISNITNG
jgi:hypothetical protein